MHEPRFDRVSGRHLLGQSRLAQKGGAASSGEAAPPLPWFYTGAGSIGAGSIGAGSIGAGSIGASSIGAGSIGASSIGAGSFSADSTGIAGSSAIAASVVTGSFVSWPAGSVISPIAGSMAAVSVTLPLGLAKPTGIPMAPIG